MYNNRLETEFFARLWLFDNRIHDVEVWVHRLDPVDVRNSIRPASVWIREAILDIHSFNVDELYDLFHLKKRFPESDEYDGFQIVCKGVITGWYSQPYNEWDEDIEYEFEDAQISAVVGQYFYDEYDPCGLIDYERWLRRIGYERPKERYPFLESLCDLLVSEYPSILPGV